MTGASRKEHEDGRAGRAFYEHVWEFLHNIWEGSDALRPEVEEAIANLNALYWVGAPAALTCTCTEDESSDGSASREDDPHCPIHGWCSWQVECARLTEDLARAEQSKLALAQMIHDQRAALVTATTRRDEDRARAEGHVQANLRPTPNHTLDLLAECARLQERVQELEAKLAEYDKYVAEFTNGA